MHRLRQLLYMLHFRLAVLFHRPGRRADDVDLTVLIPFHNEIDQLPGWFRSVVSHADRIIGLDDGSTDGSAELFESFDKVAAVIRKRAGHPHVWNEPENKQRLLEQAQRLGADWILVLDADERLERDFRRRAGLAMRLAQRYGYSAVSARLGELWDRPDYLRVDGIWGKKSRARLFRLLPDHQVCPDALHGAWISTAQNVPGGVARADLWTYHLGMLTEQERIRRRERYQQLDPENRWQSVGYDYLTDTRGIRLRPVPAARMYER